MQQNGESWENGCVEKKWEFMTGMDPRVGKKTNIRRCQRDTLGLFSLTYGFPNAQGMERPVLLVTASHVLWAS